MRPRHPHNHWLRITAAACLSAIMFAPRAAGDDETLRRNAQDLFGMLEPTAETMLSTPGVVLGRELFWDPRLSADGKTACASCHLREDQGADRRTFSTDAKGKLTKRNSQTVFNSTGQPSLRWTGNRKSAAEQAEKSLTGSMGFAAPEDAVRKLRELGYEAAFRRAFPDEDAPVTAANYGRAIEAYERTLMTPSPFDKFLAGDRDALSTSQKNGLQKFIEIGCADCHSGPLLGGDSLRTFGVMKDYWTATESKNIDPGRFEDTQKEIDKYVFRVSMLRNIVKTGPFFHDGSVTQLAKAVQIMAEVQLGVALSDDDTGSIVEFLDSLTGQVPAHFAPPRALQRGAAQQAARPTVITAWQTPWALQRKNTAWPPGVSYHRS